MQVLLKNLVNKLPGECFFLNWLFLLKLAHIAQLVERFHGKEEVFDSNSNVGTPFVDFSLI